MWPSTISPAPQWRVELHRPATCINQNGRINGCYEIYSLPNLSFATKQHFQPAAANSISNLIFFIRATSGRSVCHSCSVFHINPYFLPVAIYACQVIALVIPPPPPPLLPHVITKLIQ